MNTKEIIKLKMSMVMNEDDINRIGFLEIAEKKLEVVADVHGMTRQSAKRFLKNIIAIIRNEFFLLVIHGYNHGCVIRDMIWNTAKEISDRIQEMNCVEDNQGRTLITVTGY